MSVRDRLGMTPTQATCAWLLVLIIGGLSGLVALLICMYLLSFGGKDSVDKHGISQVEASRIGGVAIVTYMALHLGYQYHSNELPQIPNGLYLMAIALSYFALGFFEDMQGSLGARLRFFLMLAIAVVALLLTPELILAPVGILVVDWLVATPTTAVIFTTVCIAFLANAFNTADGANGLVSGITLLALAGLIEAAPLTILPYLSACMVSCLIFLVFNIISGRFFLGDGGAYLLGAFCGTSLITIANQSEVSTWWLLSLIFSPPADLLFSMMRRWLSGGSAVRADNLHLHNLMYAQINRKLRSAYWSNTVTGVGIALCFSGIPLVLQTLDVVPINSDQWLWVVVGQWTAYGLVWRFARQLTDAMPESSS